LPRSTARIRTGNAETLQSGPLVCALTGKQPCARADGRAPWVGVRYNARSACHSIKRTEAHAPCALCEMSGVQALLASRPGLPAGWRSALLALHVPPALLEQAWVVLAECAPSLGAAWVPESGDADAAVRMMASLALYVCTHAQALEEAAAPPPGLSQSDILRAVDVRCGAPAARRALRSRAAALEGASLSTPAALRRPGEGPVAPRSAQEHSAPQCTAPHSGSDAHAARRRAGVLSAWQVY
jgi:hypothetical protein